MSQSLVDIIIHFVFSTKDRSTWIKSDIEEELYQYICGVSRNLNCKVININGVEDHIHVLVQMGKTISISKFVSEIKSSSSRWIKTKGNHFSEFSWQKGYGGFSVSRPVLEGVNKYISSQKEHHRTVSFKEELIAMLIRAEIPFDEKFLWE